jgi:hydroxyethylthiazole kinase-like uncharacterized protein yjeF
MKPLLSRAQMRAFDAHAIAQCRVPSLVLMENAGRGATEVLVAEMCSGDASGAKVVVVCGTGNNGGDGLVVARRLAVLAAKPVVVVAGDLARASTDTLVNLEAWRGIGGEIREISAGAPLSTLTDSLAAADIVVDALFGTGLDRAVDGFFAGVVRAVNASCGKRFALDLPSGMDADTGAALGVAVEATCTATFAHAKIGLRTPNGARLAGRVHVVDIGVPASLATHVGEVAQEMGPADVAGWRGQRPSGAYKTTAGHVVVVGGSPGKIGAPQLVARGAMRAGAGLVTIATWPGVAASIDGRVLEVMTARLDPSRLAETVDDALKHKQAVVMGPGLGLDDDARAVVDRVLALWPGPVVVDADALTLNAGKPNVFARAKKAILTPHPGEAGRLLGKPPAEIEADRYRAARDLTAASGSVVVLKGAHTIVASPDSRVAVSPVACPALATAGAGDVLGGIIAAMACTLAPFEAACAGVMLHALAGQAWSSSHGGADRGMLASDVADALTTLSFR